MIQARRFLSAITLLGWLFAPSTCEARRHRFAPATPTPSPVITYGPVSTPKPTSTPTATGILPWSAPSNYPPATWQPYASNSVWNTPLSNPSPDPNSAAYQSYYAQFPYFASIGFGLSNESGQYGHPIYFGHATDPTYNVSCSASWSPCVGTQTVHVPAYAVPAEGGDHHLGVIDETNGKEFDFWEASPLSGKGGTISTASSGEGPVSDTGLNFGTTGAGFPLWAGVIRAQEEIAGSIDHALFMVAPCTNNNSPVFPSIYRSTDTECTNNSGAPYGARLRLNMTDAQILALGAPLYKVPIYMAAAHYGMYIGDTNGNYGFGLQFEADEMYTKAGYKNSKCPTNGAPCTPLTAYFHSIGDPGWNGSMYVVDLNEVNWKTYGQWLLPPK